VNKPALTATVSVVILAAGCRPALDDRPWLVGRTRILGVKAEPPEAAPGAGVTMAVVALGPTEPLDTSGTTWTLCRTPKPLGENRVVDPSCLVPTPDAAVGSSVELAIPADACTLFGPDTPQPAPGAPPTRPRDPDATGGYFQPTTVVLEESTAVALERVACGLSGASLDTTRAFQAAYHPNQNPTITGLAFSVDGTAVDPGAVPRGARVIAEVSWLAGSAEQFPVFDRASGGLVDTREVLTASWYVTGGDLDRAASETDDPTVTAAATGWTAPASPATLEIVVVLRDSRGGMDSARSILIVN
jgi:hypothetical protein